MESRLISEFVNSLSSSKKPPVCRSLSLRSISTISYSSEVSELSASSCFVISESSNSESSNSESSNSESSNSASSVSGVISSDSSSRVSSLSVSEVVNDSSSFSTSEPPIASVVFWLLSDKLSSGKVSILFSGASVFVVSVCWSILSSGWFSWTEVFH